MSKYEKLWDYLKENGADKVTLTNAEIEMIIGFPIDHTFLSYKKELIEYGYKVGNISMKEQKIEFRKNPKN